MVKAWKDKTAEEQKLFACSKIMKSKGFILVDHNGNCIIGSCFCTKDLKFGESAAMHAIGIGEIQNEMMSQFSQDGNEP